MMTATKPTVRVTLPPRFYEDHAARDLPSGEVVGKQARSLIVELDAAALADLRSDAAYYVESADSLAPEARGLVASARATLRRLEGVEAPVEEEPVEEPATAKPSGPRLYLTESQTDALRGYLPPEEGAGPEWNAMADRIAARLGTVKATSLTQDEAQMIALYLGDLGDDLPEPQQRLRVSLARRTGLDA